jgi:hypothetical protein
MRKGAERCRDACRVARPDVLVKFRYEGSGTKIGAPPCSRKSVKEGEHGNLNATGGGSVEIIRESGNGSEGTLNGGAMGYDGFDMVCLLFFVAI